MISRSGNIAVKAFIEGKAKSTKNTVSTGRELFLFGNKIAVWRKDGLYVSNGGYTVYTRSGNEVVASVTTKVRLNDLPGVRVSQSKSVVTVNGKEMQDGVFIHIPETGPGPKHFDTSGDFFLLSTSYHKIDGWRGFSEYDYGVVAGNDTGTWADSPCNTNILKEELDAVIAKLTSAGIKHKHLCVNTSNVFCISHQIVVKVKDVKVAREIVQEYLSTHKTYIIYLMEGKKDEKQKVA